MSDDSHSEADWNDLPPYDPLRYGVVLAGAFLEWRFAAGKGAAERAWRGETAGRLLEVGSTLTLAVLPLVDWYAAGMELRGEPGVSYLVRTDRSTVLFDVGANLGDRDPSPLVANMQRLGISLADVDTVVLSHRHEDHWGGPDSPGAARSRSVGSRWTCLASGSSRPCL